MSKLYYGIEVEMVAVDEKTGKPVPMTEIAPSKDAPHVLPTGELVHADCCGAETATTPSKSLEEVLSSLHRGFKWWEENYPNLKLVPEPVAIYDNNDLHPINDWSIGCSPSVCVWPKAPPTPTEYVDTSRCYGLHITFDLPDGIMSDIEELVKAIDFKIALWCQANSPSPELDKKRREIGYGRPGEIRMKDINGKSVLEYRTLPNWAYTKLDYIIPELEKLVFNKSYRDSVVDEYSKTPDFWKQLVKEV